MCLMTKQKWSEGQALLKGRFLTVKGHLSTFGKREICFRQRILLASLELIQLQKEIVSNSRITIDEISPTNIGTESFFQNGVIRWNILTVSINKQWITIIQYTHPHQTSFSLSFNMVFWEGVSAYNSTGLYRNGCRTLKLCFQEL